jgi:hypothetical protein
LLEKVAQFILSDNQSGRAENPRKSSETAVVEAFAEILENGWEVDASGCRTHQNRALMEGAWFRLSAAHGKSGLRREALPLLFFSESVLFVA